MRHVDVKGLRETAEARLAFLEQFTLFSDDDWQALRESAEILGPKLPGILDALYDHLLSFDDTRRIFLGPRGEVDPDYIAIRKDGEDQSTIDAMERAQAQL